MKAILSALILSAATIGAAQAGELGYPPAPQSGGALSHQQVQAELNQARANGVTGNGELIQLAQTPQAQSSQLTRAQVQRDIQVSRGVDLNGNGELDSPVSNG
ncbi:DUF4148 domain-containing protein [Pigmentiphaga aceris]|uniref:DUF4148 domain-containing protein n=1 Tax=Pigmentiphaga aceris TaxID=1940612 RepID=A0A5C0B4W5_9BURK|nr:DUF4148 domain-containing protein [Pigmentiphaga aceris]QEI07617.1 DUF4148 domain-containing protein [Pigmentiphaga aceris]